MAVADGSSTSDDRLATGGYARKQIFCKDRFIAWSHHSRFRMARKLVEPLAGKRLLDYGCGDATFLILVHDLFPRAVGADIDPRQNADCARRLADWSEVSFCLTSELDDPRHDGAYDVIVCMEVLEHCLPPDVEAALGRFRRLLAPGGLLLVSVPIEIGPSLLLKEAVRTVAGWRGLGNYRTKETYSLRELTRMVFAGEGTSFPRPSYESEFVPGLKSTSYGHKGFNWKALRKRLREDFVVESTRFTPLGWSGGLLSSQVWFTCRAKPAS
jgi:2-polyprenyl-3-methyl-5-hydroxy-6-metoxy-1,4-benzoquinol methylase